MDCACGYTRDHAPRNHAAEKFTRPPAAPSNPPLLRRLLVAGTPHLAAFSDASPEANAAWARAYCQQRNSSFGAAGTVRRGVLPPPLAGHAAAVLTYSPADGRTCIGRDCPFVAVVECVPAGAEPCTADEQGNVG